MKRALLVIAKQPYPGLTKTRLTPPFVPEEAADLYACFLQDTLDLVRTISGVERYMLYAPADAAGYFTNLAPDFLLLAQSGIDLGQRLDNALSHCLSIGFEQVIVMNSDGPTLPADYIKQAYDLLNESEAVFGPSDDGGYYLVGLTQPQSRLLREVQMSTPTVLQDTLALAKVENVKVSLLPPWYDVDTFADLQRLAIDVAHLPDHKAPYTRAFLKRKQTLFNDIRAQPSFGVSP